MSGPPETSATSLRRDGGSDNEDAFLIRTVPGGLLVALADGAGTALLAARRVLRRIERSIADAGRDELTRFGSWKRWLHLADAELQGGCESTLVAVVVLGQGLFGAAVGDSRAYLWDRDGGLTILTAEADKHRLGSGRIEPFPIHARLARREILLLLSDGAWTPLPLERCRRTIASCALGPLARLPESILAESSRYGRADDMTAIAVRPR